MPKIEPASKDIRYATGLHLFHAGWSNCSMRVRMTLEEKACQWTSHHLNTRIGEHITPEYFGIHPNGLVPALIHDGDVWIESHDIIRYLDRVFPVPRLTPEDDAGLAMLSKWRKLASDIHVSAIKTYIYSSRPKARSGKSAEDLERYRRLQPDAQLREFHARHSSDSGLTEQDRENAEQLLHAAFAQLDAYLGEHRWLAGEQFSLAEITWVPLHYTLKRAGYSVDAHANVKGWSQAVAARPSFQKAIVDWFDGPPGAGSPSAT
jgi:GST-like protein